MSKRRKKLLWSALIASVILIGVASAIYIGQNADDFNEFAQEHTDEGIDDVYTGEGLPYPIGDPDDDRPGVHNDRISTQEEGDPTDFIEPLTPDVWTQDEFRVFDTYGPVDCNLNGSDEMIVAYENSSGATSDLWLELVTWDGETITVGPKVFVIADVVNASVWIGDLIGSGLPYLSVVGTQTGGFAFIFVYSISVDGIFTIETQEIEMYHPGSTETYYTDSMIADINTTSIQHEICITGFTDNLTKYDGITEVWQIELGALVAKDQSRFWVTGEAGANLKMTALDVQDIKDSSDLEWVSVGYYQTTVALRGWVSWFHSSDYPFSDNNGYANMSTLLGPDESELYDVRIGDFDYDSTVSKVIVIGYHDWVTGGPDTLLSVLNWTSAAPTAEYYANFTVNNDGDDYSLGFEVEFAPSGIWDTDPILVIFGASYDINYDDYYMYFKYAYDSPEWLYNDTTRGFALYHYWSELMIGGADGTGDADGDGYIELWNVWNYDEFGGSWTRETIVFPMTLNLEGPPGRYHNGDETTTATGRYPDHLDNIPEEELWERSTLMELYGWWLVWLIILIIITALLALKGGWLGLGAGVAAIAIFVGCVLASMAYFPGEEARWVAYMEVSWVNWVTLVEGFSVPKLDI